MLLRNAYPTTKAKVDLEVSLELELQKTIKVRKLEELKWVDRRSRDSPIPSRFTSSN
jgi:hypothetical protein